MVHKIEATTLEWVLFSDFLNVQVLVKRHSLLHRRLLDDASHRHISYTDLVLVRHSDEQTEACPYDLEENP